MKRLQYLKNKLLRQPHLQEGYIKTVQVYIEDGYARKLTTQELQNEKKFGTWYIPHHAVTHPKKPGKVRVVFDCAAQFLGKSLNDHLYTGPDILNSQIGILLKLCQEKFAIVEDVEAMYHQVKVHKEDEDFPRFLWLKDGDLWTNRRVLHDCAGFESDC